MVFFQQKWYIIISSKKFLLRTFTTYDKNTRSDLYVALPVLSQGKKWVLLYSTWRHGISLSTLYRRSNLCPGLSLLGSNDTFVFTNTPGRPVIYRPIGTAFS
ncbi:unnamed protein product [Lactuca saligna]|uniref:Uncharacterized protein n=1 Tax=Lactuca saligna TaxID=75948 RepID=A0AA35ZVH5_LACSI|nr:unnamed protein product [Lactuca saligna]